jgi:signal transduction histidine kinase
VRVAVECQGEELCFAVEDQGPGIPAEVLDGLGRPFLQRATEQAEPDDAAPWGRPGLGLYLTGLMISIHGGRLLVSRGNTAGTIARLCFPIARVRPAEMRSSVERRMEDQLVSRVTSI